MAVRKVGSSLSDAQQSLIKSEIYGENDGNSLSIEGLLVGLDLAAELVTSYEKIRAAYV